MSRCRIARVANHMMKPDTRSTTLSIRLEMMEKDPDRTLATTLATISSCREDKAWRQTTLLLLLLLLSRLS